MSTLTKQKANLNNITVYSKFNEESYITEHHVIAEWSRTSMESFHSLEDAQDFINGFKGLETDRTPAYIKGTILRHCVDTDINEGIIYDKVLDVNSLYNSEAL
jgi:hypothetical protein